MVPLPFPSLHGPLGWFALPTMQACFPLIFVTDILFSLCFFLLGYKRETWKYLKLITVMKEQNIKYILHKEKKIFSSHVDIEQKIEVYVILPFSERTIA